MSAFIFINSNPRPSQAAREAVKVHVLRLRRDSHPTKQNARKNLSEDDWPGGQFHIWEPQNEQQEEQASRPATHSSRQNDSALGPGLSESTQSMDSHLHVPSVSARAVAGLDAEYQRTRLENMPQCSL